MEKRCVALGLDIGTSSLKTTALDVETGEAVWNRRYEYGACEERPGVVAAHIYEQAVLEGIGDTARTCRVQSIGVTTQMYSLCEETGQGRLVHQWNSPWPRSEACDHTLGGIAGISGCPADTIFPAYKLVSLGEARRAGFLPFGVKEHIIQMLTDTLATDYTTASASGLFDVIGRRWNAPLLESLGYRHDAMPAVHAYDRPIGTVRSDILDGLFEGALVVPGLGDGPSASLACRSISANCANLGTSFAVRSIGHLKDAVPGNALWTYAFDDVEHIIGGISSNGCSALQWARTSGLGEPALSDTGSVRFFPWLTGERTPYWSSNLRGAFVGLDLGTSREALEAAVVKGVAFTLCRMAEALEAATKNTDLMILAGGGVHIAPLVEAVSGALPMRSVVLEESDHLASFGAALSAAKPLGMAPRPSIRVNAVREPDEGLRTEYGEWRELADRIARVY